MNPGHSDPISCHRQALVLPARAQHSSESLLQLARVQNSARGEQVGNGSILHLRKQPWRARWHPRTTEPPASLETELITSPPLCSSALTVIAGQFYTTSTQGSFWLCEFKRRNQQWNIHHSTKKNNSLSRAERSSQGIDSCSSPLCRNVGWVPAKHQPAAPIAPAGQTILPPHTYFHSKNDL